MERSTNRAPQQEVDLLSQSFLIWFFGLLGRARRLVLQSCIVVALVSTLVSFLLPKWYESTATFLPPRETGLLGSMGSLSTALREFAPLRSIGGLGGARGASYNYLSILDSRSAKGAVIRKFDLIRVYDVPDSSMEKAIKALEENVSIDVAEEGHISVTVLDMDPQRAAAMANYYVEILNEINTELNTQSSTKYREFLEEGVKEAKDSLRVYEEAYKSFQKKNGIFTVPDDIQGGAKAVAQLYSEKMLREIEVQFLSKVLGKDNPELERRQMELQVLNQKVAMVPDLGLENLRLYRNLVIQAKILEVLIPLYEQARLEEKKETPSVAVLDKAVPAERKSKPKRMLIILVSTLSAGLLSFSYFAIRERLKKMESDSPEQYEVLRSFFRARRRS